MKGKGREALGKWLFRGWKARKRIYETPRPGLTGFLPWLIAGAGLLLVVEGLLAGWFPDHLAPESWELASLYETAPWIKPVSWIAGVALIALGLSAFLAALSLGRHGAFGTYLTVLSILQLLSVSVVLLYSGVRFSSAALTTLGSLGVGWCLIESAILALCWYSLDPLGIHWREIADKPQS